MPPAKVGTTTTSPTAKRGTTEKANRRTGVGTRLAECARPRAMPLGFRSIFFQVFAGVRTTSIERQVGEAQVGLGARVVRTRLAAAPGQTMAQFLEGFRP